MSKKLQYFNYINEICRGYEAEVAKTFNIEVAEIGDNPRWLTLSPSDAIALSKATGIDAGQILGNLAGVTLEELGYQTNQVVERQAPKAAKALPTRQADPAPSRSPAFAVLPQDGVTSFTPRKR